MSSIVYCTFDQQDIADLAIGKLRNSVKGIQNIQYLNDHNSEFVNGYAEPGIFAGWVGTYSSHIGVHPSRPVSIKITCDTSSRETVTAKLVNLHAYKIVCS